MSWERDQETRENVFGKCVALAAERPRLPSKRLQEKATTEVGVSTGAALPGCWPEAPSPLIPSEIPYNTLLCHTAKGK